MQIPYEVQARPDTGLYNAKLGIWLFLASEVMLFGGLFSAYIFLRLGAEPGYWPHGLLNVPIGTFNTAVLIGSSVTVIMAWASLKMRNFRAYKMWMAITIACGLAFLFIKLAFEWPPKFEHFGAYIRKDKLEEYEKYLGNEHLKEHKLPARVEITGHLHEVEVEGEKAVIENFAREHSLTFKEAPGGHGFEVEVDSPRTAEKLAAQTGVKLLAFSVNLDPVNTNPASPDNDRPHFIPQGQTGTMAKIEVGDVDSWSAFVPKHNTYFATYFMITGLHGAHVLAGVIVFCHMWLFGAELYKKNPEHLANRVEVAGLFWHFVDLVWIFVFPLFYLL